MKLALQIKGTRSDGTTENIYPERSDGKQTDPEIETTSVGWWKLKAQAAKPMDSQFTSIHLWSHGRKIEEVCIIPPLGVSIAIGGSGAYSSYGDYRADLQGAQLILAPDRASDGLKYIANIERDFPNQIVGYYLAGTQGLWVTRHRDRSIDKCWC